MREQKLFERDFEEKAGLVLDAVEEARAQLPFNRNDELDKYFAAFKQYSKFRNHEAFLEVHRRYRGGVSEEEKRAARDEIVYRNMRLVFSVAYPMSGRGLGLLDMLQEGAIGLMAALEKYEVERGFRFSTYATHWIRQAVSRAIQDLNEHRPYRIPVHIQGKMVWVYRAVEKYTFEHGVWPEARQVVDALQREEIGTARAVTLRDAVICMRIILEGYWSLDYVYGEEEDEAYTLHDIKGDVRVDTESMVEARRMLGEYEAALARITSEVDKLDPRSAMVIRLRYGLGEFDRLTLEEVGERYEVTRERIRQIEVQALSKLGEAMSISLEEVEQILAVVDELRKITGAEPAEKTADAASAKPTTLPDRVSLDSLFGLLTEHVILTPAGLRIVKGPLPTLQVRGRLTLGEAELALGDLQTRGLIEGGAPWAMIQIIPEVAIPEFRAGGGRIGTRGADLEYEDVDEDEGGEAPASTPSTSLIPARAPSHPVPQPRPDRPVRPHPASHRRRAGVILERLMYAEAYEVLVARASGVSGERVVRGAVPILETWFKIWSQDATKVLEKLAEQAYIAQRDGWRVIVLHYDRLDRQELMFGTCVPVPAPTPRPAPTPVAVADQVVRVATAPVKAAPLRVILGGGTSPSKEAVRAPAAPMAQSVSPAQGPRHDVLDTAVRWIEQQLPHLRSTLGEAHERLVKLEVACITLRKARDGHQQAAGAVESAIAEMESAMVEFFALLRQGS